MTNQTLAMKELGVVKFDALADWQMMLKLFLFSIAASLVLLMGYFVFQTNNQMAESATIMGLEARIAELKGLNNNLEVSLVNTGSIEKILPLINNMNFEKSVNVSYIKVPSDKVVVNKN